MLKVYIAAPWVRKEEAIAVGKRFEDAGIEITSRWFNHPGTKTDSTGLTEHNDIIRTQALQDVEDVQRADVLVVLNLEKSEGKAVETGIALASGSPIIAVGTRSNIFQILGTVVPAVEEALQMCVVASRLRTDVERIRRYSL